MFLSFECKVGTKKILPSQFSGKAGELRIFQRIVKGELLKECVEKIIKPHA